MPPKFVPPPFVMPTFGGGGALVDLTKANAIAAELEDAERIRKHEQLTSKPAQT